MTYQQSGKLNIVAAVYGLERVTTHVQALINKDGIETLNLKVTNDAIGIDGWRGQVKSLTVVYNYDGGPLHVACAKESESLLINPDSLNDHRSDAGGNNTNDQRATILAATYGPQNVTEKILAMVDSNNNLSFQVDNSVLADTWHGIAKTLVLILGYGNVVTAVKIFLERQHCDVSLDESVPAF